MEVRLRTLPAMIATLLLMLVPVEPSFAASSSSLFSTLRLIRFDTGQTEQKPLPRIRIDKPDTKRLREIVPYLFRFALAIVNGCQEIESGRQGRAQPGGLLELTLGGIEFVVSQQCHTGRNEKLRFRKPLPKLV